MFVGCVKNVVPDWSQFSLVIPTVSVGNVGQLACDVIISTLQARKVGHLYDDSVVPLVGPDPFSVGPSRNIATAIDVYESTEHKVVVVQQRAPLLKGRIQTFVDRLVDWISSCRFKQIIVLTSVFAHERIDSQLTGAQTRFVASPALLSLVGNDYLANELHWVRLEKRPSDDNDLFIPGSGMAKKLFMKGVSTGLPVLVLLTFCAEGDNTPEALTLATYANSFMKWFPSVETDERANKIWQIPASWRLLFGHNFDQLLYM